MLKSYLSAITLGGGALESEEVTGAILMTEISAFIKRSRELALSAM